MSAKRPRLREFELCEDCDSPEDCLYNAACPLEERPKPGFNFTQEEEDRLNDPRHGQGDK